jgi:hypothetical protein
MRAGRRVVVLMLAGVTAILAPGGRAAAEAPNACQADVQKFCSTVQGGGGRILICLQEHVKELSPDCQKQLDSARRHTQMRHLAHPNAGPWVAPCTGDIQKLCREIPAGAGRIAQCLAQHQSDLSDGCKAAFSGAGSGSGK